MGNTLKNVLGIIAGFFIGSAVNMGIVTLGYKIIPAPVGADLTSNAGMKAAMEIMEPQNFIFPFLAHAGGTLVGAFLAAKIAGSLKKEMALIIGVLFLMGGFTAIYMWGGPTWFKFLDLLAAYIPMAILGWILAGGNGVKNSKVTDQLIS